MVERLEALEAVATCRPWEVYETQGGEYGIRGGPLCSEGCCQDIIVYDGPSEADASLIVAMRNALPALLFQLREQRERADELQKSWDTQIKMYAEARIQLHAARFRFSEQGVRLAAAERTVREQREALERIAAGCNAPGVQSKHDRTLGPCGFHESQSIALAALAPDTEGEGT